MLNLYQKKLYHYFFIVILFGLSIWLQKNILLNWDVSWHLLGAERMLHGAGYLNGVFDDNPPMVFWIYIPVVLISHYFSISIITTQIIFVECAILCTFILCHILLKHLEHNRLVLQYSFLVALLFFQGEQFGQREMLLTIFCLPYVACMLARIQNNTRFDTTLLIVTGLWSALGVALNPLYGLIVIALETQQFIITKKISLHRPEIIAFSIGCLSYLLIIYFFYHDYYTEVIPAILTFSPGFNQPFSEILYRYFALFFYAATILFFATYHSSEFKRQKTTLWLVAAVSFFIDVGNKKIWYYHAFPYIVFTFALLVMLCCDALFKPTREKLPIAPFTHACSFILALAMCTSIMENSICAAKHRTKFTHEFAQFIHFFNHQPAQHRTVYNFSTIFYPIFPLINYTTLRYIPGRPDCWTIPRIMQNRMQQTAQDWQLQLIQHYQKQFVTKTTRDFQQYKPDYVIVDNSKYKAYLHGITFDYISFLKQSAEFQKIWKNYLLIKTIGDQKIYKRRS